MLEKVVGAAKTRHRGPPAPETQRRKNALESSSLPAKLADCRSDDVDRSELFIVEGDSALGTAKLARNSEFQALLPIRGKILNVQKASRRRHAQERRVRLDHPGRSAPARAAPSTSTRPATARIILMADADVDGAHIRTPAADAVLPVHAADWSTRAGSSPPCRRCTGSS